MARAQLPDSRANWALASKECLAPKAENTRSNLLVLRRSCDFHLAICNFVYASGYEFEASAACTTAMTALTGRW